MIVFWFGFISFDWIFARTILELYCFLLLVWLLFVSDICPSFGWLSLTAFSTLFCTKLEFKKAIVFWAGKINPIVSKPRYAIGVGRQQQHNVIKADTPSWKIDVITFSKNLVEKRLSIASTLKFESLRLFVLESLQ